LPRVKKTEEETKKTVKATKTTAKKTTTAAKKTTTKKATTTKAKTTKTATKKSTTTTKKTATKKSTTKTTAVKKTTTKKPTTAKATKIAKTTKASKTTKAKKAISPKTTTKKKTTTRKTKLSSEKIIEELTKLNNIAEYYDLPYRYNETVVKVLAQNPTTLFVYWDISDNDKILFEEKYGKDFFTTTKPILIVHNLTYNYTYEVEINDFANNWYLTVTDSNSKYVIELARKRIDPNEIFMNDGYDLNTLPQTFLRVSASNIIESPNDHILFFKNNQRISFINTVTNKITEKVINLKNDKKDITAIYSHYSLDEDDQFDFTNPSSTMTSNVM
jgi:hypothetical protein